MVLYDLRNFRSEDQLEEMRALDEAGVCVFCPQVLTAAGRHPILHETDHWLVTRNKYPYPNTRLHLLLVPKVHADDLLDLPAASRDEYWSVLGWVRDRYRLNFYCIGSRNGDVHSTGSSIAHVHVHVVVGDVDDPAHQPVRFKMSSPPPG